MSKGNCCALTVIVRFTRWGEVIPVAGIFTNDIKSEFLLHWVARFGCPSVITCNRGPQFISTLWQSQCLFLGSKLSHRCTCRIILPPIICANVSTNKSKLPFAYFLIRTGWVTHLPWVLIGIKSSLKEDLRYSAAWHQFSFAS